MHTIITHTTCANPMKAKDFIPLSKHSAQCHRAKGTQEDYEHYYFLVMIMYQVD